MHARQQTVQWQVPQFADGESKRFGASWVLVDRELRDIRPAFVRMFELRTAIPIVLVNALAVLLAFALFELALHAVGVNNVTYAQAAYIYALGHILAAVSMLPGGVGIYEGVLTAFMVLQGVPPSQGTHFLRASSFMGPPSVGGRCAGPRGDANHTPANAADRA